MINGIVSGIPSIATGLSTGATGAANGQAPATNFADVFQSAVSDVDSLQNNADQQVVNLLQGKGNADIGGAMVSVEKADVAFQLMMQVRNKVVSAYQEMEKMQF
ncbi:MAG TPA: flagellar hook-basal body complex protein FliE [Acidobacteriaceae bacterium]|nr:flagellar hook-basal body complex protein FliE [Acidobacteriaceae bacterium]